MDTIYAKYIQSRQNKHLTFITFTLTFIGYSGEELDILCRVAILKMGAIFLP